MGESGWGALREGPPATLSHMCGAKLLRDFSSRTSRLLIFFSKIHVRKSIRMRGGGLGSRPKKMYWEYLGDGVEYHLMKPTRRR